MALKFRRGTTAQKSGSLAFGEPYVNTTLGTLQIGLDTGDVTLASSNGLISGSSQLTSSYDGRYETQGRGIISSSAQIDSLFNIDGLISGSSQVTISSTTGYSTFSSSLDSRITTEKGRIDAILSAADADKDTFAEIVTLINSVDTTNDSAFASFYTSSVNRLNNLESTSASVNVSISNINSYTASNDSTNTTQNTRLTALEASASTALSTNNTQATSITNLNSTTASLLIETANLETFSGSTLTRLTALESSASTALSTNNSQATSITNLNSTTASLNTSVSNLNSFSSSALTRLSNLEGTDISITLTGDVTGTGTITNLANVSFATTIAANSVALGTDTTGDYVASLVAGTGVSLSNNSGEGATPTIAIGQAVATSSSPTFAGLTINGAITATGDITAYYSSDKRFKSNIQIIPNALEKVSKLNGVTWTWNEDVNEVTKTTPNTGLIAQEVQEVLPEVVMEREDGHLGLDYSKMVGLLVEAIKEQQTQIHSLTLQIEELKKQKGL